MSQEILIGKADTQIITLNSSVANRHGLIAGATGTGKTLTLQTLAQGFSNIGTPVFLADIKGDLSGLAVKGQSQPKIDARLNELKLADFQFTNSPVVFWDIFAQKGHPVRATISDMGPLMLARLLNLNDTQEGVLHLIFKIADEKNLHIIDLKDLQALLTYVAENAKQFQVTYGNISAASVGAIQRSLLSIESQGASSFLGEPMLNILDFIQTDENGKGIINILSAEKLMLSPKLYSVFLLWMLSELFENLPEVGDLDKPKIVFFFDEAHLLFADAPKALTEKIEQVVRLIRSKGVGIYFITQNPLDLPETVLAQLGHRVQHALRAFTPKDKKAVTTVAETMRENEKFKTADAITQLAVGEALVSVLLPNGTPSITERVLIIPPSSQIGPITDSQRQSMIKSSVLYGHYESVVDNDSAFEQLKNLKSSNTEKLAPSIQRPQKRERVSSERQTVAEVMVKTAARTMANEVGKQIIRGLLGGIFGGR